MRNSTDNLFIKVEYFLYSRAGLWGYNFHKANASDEVKELLSENEALVSETEGLEREGV